MKRTLLEGACESPDTRKLRPNPLPKTLRPNAHGKTMHMTIVQARNTLVVLIRLKKASNMQADHRH